MNTHADKTQENKSKSVANAIPQKQSGSKSTFQFVDNRPEAVAQRKLQEMANNSSQAKHAAQLQAMANNYSAQHQNAIQKKENNTGLPDDLKMGIENLSGYSMDDVKVHYNSDKPAQLQAHAYTQGSDIHIASGQEKHLPHEAWHVVQQKQGRVKPTMQMKAKININDDEVLEKEADLMGAKALNNSFQRKKVSKFYKTDTRTYPTTAQRQWINDNAQEYLKWDSLIEGVRWFSDKKADSMFFLIEKPRIAKAEYTEYQGINNAKPRAEWVELYGSDPLEAEDTTVSDVADRPFKRQGSGMDKTYYWNGGSFGWLETKPAVIDREFKAYESLSELGVKMPRLIRDATPPSTLYSKEGESLGPPKNGYWIEHIPMDKTYKPAMMVFGASDDFKKVMQSLPPEASAKVRNDLRTIKEKSAGISNIVGELTIAIHQYTGDVYLLDFAADESGRTGGDDLADRASRGIDKMI